MGERGREQHLKSHQRLGKIWGNDGKGGKLQTYAATNSAENKIMREKQGRKGGCDACNGEKVGRVRSRIVQRKKTQQEADASTGQVKW